MDDKRFFDLKDGSRIMYNPQLGWGLYVWDGQGWTRARNLTATEVRKMTGGLRG